jgi:hypothetical protein
MSKRYPEADLHAGAKHRDAPLLPGGTHGRTGWYGEVLVARRRPGGFPRWEHLEFCPHAHRDEFAAARCARDTLLPGRIERPA